VLFLLNLADGMISTIASAYAGSLGYSLADIGLIVSLYSIASLVSRLPSAHLADGRRADAWLYAACALNAATFAVYPFATAPAPLWIVRILHGLTFGTATTLNLACFLAVCTPSNRTTATALFTASWSGGYSIGNFVSGVMADNFGFTPTFLVAAVCPLLAIVAQPRLRPAPLPSSGEARSMPTWRVLFHPEVRGVPVLAFSIYFHNSLLATLFPLYVLAIGQTLSVAGSARALQSLTNTLVRPLSGPLMRRVGPLELGAAGVALTALAIVVIPFSVSPFVLLALFVAVGAGRAVGVVANATGTLDLAERGILKRGTASALMTAGGDSGSVVAPLLAGATAAAINLGPTLQVLAVGMAVVGVAVLLSGRRQGAPAFSAR
jgi:MFS family permease